MEILKRFYVAFESVLKFVADLNKWATTLLSFRSSSRLTDTEQSSSFTV